MTNTILGIDVGASGIKGAMVDLLHGKIVGERFRVVTPQPSTTTALARAFADLVTYFDYRGDIGCGFPALMKNGIAQTAANIDSSWIGADVQTILGTACGCPVWVTNDADAAGMAEMRFGKGKNEHGLVILITIGTGLGTAVFYRNTLLPNTELGHLKWNNGKSAELYCSSGARERLKISRKEWAVRFNEYLMHLELLFSPDLFILGGGESKYFDVYREMLTVSARVEAATLLNNAGIIGAAAYASEYHSSFPLP